jgi:cytoskeletal protein CcmA (bactofilin family)
MAPSSTSTPAAGARVGTAEDRAAVLLSSLPLEVGFLAIFGKQDSHPPALREAGPSGGPTAPTVLGPQARFVGELFGDEDILINGRFEGKVRVDRNVTVGPSGDVVGDVLGKSVVVAGKVQGQIRAEERAELLASAVVKGSVQAPKVVIAEGAQLQGSVAMSPEDGQPQSASEKKTS